MKLKTLIKGAVLVCTLLLFTQCQREEVVEELISNEIDQNKNLTITFSELPPNIQAAALEMERIFIKDDNSLRFAAESITAEDMPFGEIVPSVVNIGEKENYDTSYTMSLSRRDRRHFYYDNLIITEDEDGNTDSQITRYIPDTDYMIRNGINNLFTADYSGKILLYSGSGAFIVGSTFKDGERIGAAAPQLTEVRFSASGSSDCDQQILGLIVDILLLGGSSGIIHILEAACVNSSSG